MRIANETVRVTAIVSILVKIMIFPNLELMDWIIVSFSSNYMKIIVKSMNDKTTL